jgi:ATP-dependent DNA helicase RecG
MAGRGVGEGVTGGVNELVECIRANAGKRSMQIKEALNLPQRTLERWLKQLKGDGILRVSKLN